MAKGKKKEIPEFERGRLRGIREGSTQGYEYAMTIMLLVLKDKLGINEDDLQIVANEIHNYTVMVREGRVRFSLLQKTLFEDYGISFHWK